ncbi:MAG: Fic family protein [Nitrospinae bacterium]|nr:Fic family protein [Nitrospinota bacterium]
METSLWDTPLKVETHRSGHFVFQAGVDLDGLAPLIQRVEDAREFFNRLPVYPQVMARMDRIVLVEGIHGTNTIEGGTESSEEIDKIVNMPPEMIKEDSQRRISNLKKAHVIATNFALGVYDDTGKSRLVLVEEMFTDLHREITGGLKENDIRGNIPGAYRDNQKGFNTKVGDALHGGVYTPPKCRDDIALLMKNFIAWANSKLIIELSPLVRAPLVHYYFERIHPFGDGNGRTGRLIESMILKAAGFKYADFLIGKYYNDNYDHYMALFNECRKQAKDGVEYPNTPFIRFFLEGMRETIVATYDIVSDLIVRHIFADSARTLRDNKHINERQYVIVTTLLDQKKDSCTLEDIRSTPWYKSLYKKRTYDTALRDLKGLAERKLIAVDFGKGVLGLQIRPSL